MQKQKCSLELYSDFLIASQNRYSGAELSRVDPAGHLAHDSVSRWLASSNFGSSELLNQVKHLTNPKEGFLALDDSTLNKQYSRHNQLAKNQYSGVTHGLVNGINIVNLIWTEGEKIVPIDYRIYRKGTADHQDKTKHEHFREMLKRAVNKGFSKNLPVLFDAWYASIDNFKFIRSLDMKFVCTIACNRQVSVTKGVYISVQDLDFTKKQVHEVWLKEFGFVLVSQTVTLGGDVSYLATNDLTLINQRDLIKEFEQRWKIEELHRGLKQTTGIEKCYSIQAQSQKTHIFAAFRAFVKLETRRLKEGISWYEQKAEIPRASIMNYLAFGANA
jgi:hypothetical protein